MSDSPWDDFPAIHLLQEETMTESSKEPAPGPPQRLVDLARAYVADGSISAPETPALLRRIASRHLVVTATFEVAIEFPAPHQIPLTEGFVLVDYEVRPGVRNYRLAKVPANDSSLIWLGAFERHVRRTLVLILRHLASLLTTRVIFTPERKVHLLAQRARAGG